MSGLVWSGLVWSAEGGIGRDICGCINEIVKSRCGGDVGAKFDGNEFAGYDLVLGCESTRLAVLALEL